MGEIRVRRQQKEQKPKTKERSFRSEKKRSIMQSDVALIFWRVLTVKFHTPKFESLLLHVTSWEWRLAETVFSNVNLE